ncbi:hypothetical protein [Sphingobium cupriresistens]|uniref:Lipoprotein n=1 Tax=Sphingobium cupriresistens LL01 TaxID=1420583 RepID=A0A0J7Y1H7_9SPHN|nr:hypothetical protein [Sphingobium cupriresistens]KMS57776.1 hypothetical protein V473_06140 [Sphingobium cupriresistens LL01]
MARVRSIAMVSLALALAACGKGDKDASLAALDAQLTNNATDPALKGALADPIVVDPQLVGQANRNAVRSADRPANGALPALTGDAGAAQAEAVKLAGGKLLSTPTASEGEAMASTVTLGAVARADSGRRGGNGACAKKLNYGMEWAQRLPEPFGLFPGAQLTEAAGAQVDGCTLRAASFVTPAPRQGVMDYYYTLARRAGYDGEHKILGGDHVLGGTRRSDGSAYFILFTDAPGGKTGVDIIADNGR